MTQSLYILPVINRDIHFKLAGEKRLLFLVPEKCRIDLVDFHIFGKPLPLDIGFQTNSELADIEPAPMPSGEIQTDSLTINFHQPRILRSIAADIAFSKPDPPSDTDSPDYISTLACVLRVWGGNQWYLPLPVNMLTFDSTGSGTARISAKLPAVKAEKLLLNFVRLKKIPGGYLNLSTYPVDDLMEIMNFDETKAVEEEANVTVTTLTLETMDSISSLTMGLEGQPPFFIAPGGFTATVNKPQQIPDPEEAFRKAVDETPPLEIDELDIPESLKEKLSGGKKYHPLPLLISSATSGILTLQSLSASYLFHENDLAAKADSPPQASLTLPFTPDDQRKSIPKQSLFAAIPDSAQIKKIGFSIKGSLINEVRLSPEFIFPQPSGVIENMGIQANEGEKIISFFKTENENISLKAVEIPGIPKTDTLDLTFSVLNGAEGIPEPESNVLAMSSIAYDGSKKNHPVTPESQWFRFDFPEPFPLIQKDAPYWLCLEVAGGDFTWQAETASPAPSVFTYRLNKNGALIPCGPHLGQPVMLTARLLYQPDKLDDHLSIRNGAIDIGNIALENLNQIASTFEQWVDIEPTQGTFQLDYISKSEGNIDISNIEISFKDQSNPIHLIMEE